MASVIDLDELPVTGSIDVLRERMLTSPVPLDLAPHPGGRIVVHSRVADLGGVHLLCTRASGGDLIRTRRLAADDQRPSLMVSVMGAGETRVIHPGGVTRAREGDIALYVTDEPYRISFTAGAQRLTYQFPLDRLDLPRALIRRQLLDPITPDDSVAATVGAFLRSIARTAPLDEPATLAAAEGAAYDLIRILLTRTAADSAVARRARATSLGTRIELHVRRHVDDPDLSARSIAAVFSISERYVYRILAQRGVDLGDLIRERRLQRVLSLLDDGTSSLTLAAIAHKAGFADHAHLTRAFRARYGTTPSTWRARDRTDGASGKGSVPAPRAQPPAILT